MKKFLMSMVVAIFLVSGNFVEAAGFTSDQAEKIISHLSNNPAIQSSKTLNTNVESFQKSFNAQVESIVKQANLSAEDSAALQNVLLIKDYKTFSESGRNLFLNNFGNSITVLGISEENSNFKILSFCFTVPENKSEENVLDLVFTTFARVLLPDADLKKLLIEVKANSSYTQNGIKFSLFQDGTLNILDLTAE